MDSADTISFGLANWYALKLMDFDSSRSSQRWTQSGSFFISGRLHGGGQSTQMDNYNGPGGMNSANGNPVGVYPANTALNQMWTSTGK